MNGQRWADTVVMALCLVAMAYVLGRAMHSWGMI